MTKRGFSRDSDTIVELGKQELFVIQG
jgi:hypothetical protein